MAELLANEYGCIGKVRFSSPVPANKVVRRRARHGKAGVVYRCTACGGWHIGPPRKSFIGGQKRREGMYA